MKNPVRSKLILILVCILAATCQSFSSSSKERLKIAQAHGLSRREWVSHLSVPRYSSSLYAQKLPDVDSMKASELRKELESYGISTKSFFEKGELVDAVRKAREEGMKPSSGSSTVGGSKQTSSTTITREKRLEEEMAKCQSLKIGELKKELEALGVSTSTFFEKSEFVRALAEARVDGVKRKTDGSTSSGSGKKRQEETYDPSYRDVVMQKLNIDPRDMRMGPVIDVRLAK
jgi:hypothetical protein